MAKDEERFKKGTGKRERERWSLVVGVWEGKSIVRQSEKVKVTDRHSAKEERENTEYSHVNTLEYTKR